MARPRGKRKASSLSRELGQRLRSLRDERGLTQRELAERIGAEVPQISRYENGVTLPNVETLSSIANVLRIEVDALLHGTARGNKDDGLLIKDVRLLERVRELEKLDRKYRDTAAAVLEAIIVQGHQDALKQRLSGTNRG